VDEMVNNLPDKTIQKNIIFVFFMRLARARPILSYGVILLLTNSPSRFTHHLLSQGGQK